VNKEISGDFESAKIIEILTGAERSPNDPDIKLAEMLPRLLEPSGSLTYADLLEELIRDARPY
jgi:hypothetical protein